MPVISRFFGIKIIINYNDHNPPHFHAEYGEFKAVFSMKTGEQIEGKFPKVGIKIISNWARQNRKRLIENWELARSKKELKPITGADDK